MPNPSIVVRKNAAAVVAHGIPPAFQKSYYITELYKRADEIRRDGETLVSARARAMTDDVGGLLWKAAQRAVGPEVEEAAPQDEAKPKAFHEYGPAHAKIETMARAHALKHPSKSMEQCRAGAMTARPDLVDEMKREHFAAISGASPDTGDGAATKTRKADDEEGNLSGDAIQDFLAPPPANGPAGRVMQALADAHQLDNPEKSPARAYANVYADPANADLRRRVVAEHLSPQLASDAEDRAREEGADVADQQAAKYPGERDNRGSSADGRADLRTRSNGDVDKRFRFAKRDGGDGIETLADGRRVLSAEATRLAKAAGARYDRERMFG